MITMLPIRAISTFLALGVAACMVAACSAADLLNATIPRSGYHVQHLAYGSLPRQGVDLYIPDGITAPVPVIVFYYGGRWEEGDPDTFRFVGQALVSQGFVVAIPDYRHYPDVKFPAFIDDAAQAYVWVAQHAAQYGGDPGRMFAAGHSAGAQLAALVALDPEYLIAAGGSPHQVKGLIGLAGPYDFLPLNDKDLIDMFSVGDIRKSQALNYANGVLSGGAKPPAFLAYGEADTTVKPKNTINLAAALQANGNEVVVKTYPGVGHIGLVLSLTGLFKGRAPTLQDIAAFVHAHSAETPAAAPAQ